MHVYSFKWLGLTIMNGIRFFRISYIALAITILFSGFGSLHMYAQRLYGDVSQNITQESVVYIESYCHSRDYNDLYRLFNENTNNLGFWQYDAAFPGSNQIKVARLEDQFVGFIIYNKHDNQGSIDYVAIDQGIRSSGLGKILLNYAVYDLKDQGAQSVSLNVFEHNKKAQSLYERLGFCLQEVHNGLMNYAINIA